MILETFPALGLGVNEDFTGERSEADAGRRSWRTINPARTYPRILCQSRVLLCLSKNTVANHKRFHLSAHKSAEGILRRTHNRLSETRNNPQSYSHPR